MQIYKSSDCCYLIIITKEKIYKYHNWKSDMKKRTIGFDVKEYEEYSIEDFLDKWVLITTSSGKYSGKVIQVNERYICLLPYYRISPDNKGTEVYEIVYQGLPNLHRRTDILGARSTSETETINFCNGMNRKFYLQSLKEKVEKLNLEKTLGLQTEE